MAQSSFRAVLVVLLLLTIAAVFFAPSVDLEPTALRASQAARALQTILISAAYVLSSLLCIASICFPGGILDSHLVIHHDLTVLNCTRLC
jgi:hypothetical protein